MIYKHSAGGVVIEKNRILTIAWTNRACIALPKGGIRKGESSEAAAIREVKEETGYGVRAVAPLGSWTYEFSEHGVLYSKTVDYYLMERSGSADPQPQREPGEDFENCWLSIDDALAMLSFDDAREAVRIALTML